LAFWGVLWSLMAKNDIQLLLFYFKSLQECQSEQYIFCECEIIFGVDLPKRFMNIWHYFKVKSLNDKNFPQIMENSFKLLSLTVKFL
jgi:hypothetical protein